MDKKYLTGKDGVNMNFALLKKGIIYNHFVYLDTKSYEADRIFVQENIRGIRFGKEFQKSNTDFLLIMVKVQKWKSMPFAKAMGKLEHWMSLVGNTEYATLCERIFGEILGEKEE